MKVVSLLAVLAFAAQSLYGQVRTPKLTVYSEFKPSIIMMKDGRVVRQSLTNVFLKNSHLLYLQGTNVMEANMDNVVRVKFDDRLYVKIDTLLAYEVDSVGQDKLYRATVIDQVAYHQQLRNNQVITNLSLGDQLSTTTIDLSTEEDYKFPLIDIFYYLYKGKYVKVHERNLWRLLDKEQKRLMKTQMSLPDFSWTDEKSLIRLLKALQ